MRLSILVTLGLSALANAFSDEPPRDWHKALAGIPLTQYRALAPRFHRRLEGRSSHSHVYVATEKNVLAAIHPNNGTLGMLSSVEVFGLRSVVLIGRVGTFTISLEAVFRRIRPPCQLQGPLALYVQY